MFRLIMKRARSNPERVHTGADYSQRETQERTSDEGDTYLGDTRRLNIEYRPEMFKFLIKNRSF